MNKAQQQMEQWFKGTPGKCLLEAESILLNNLLPHLFGYYLLQLGGPINHQWLAHCRIPQRIHLSETCPCHFQGACVQGSFVELPFAPDSIDVALLPHVLEFAARPKEILEEIYTALIPEGYVVVLGFHPWSLWGLTRFFKSSKKVPWKGKFYSSYQMRRWLSHLGYKIEDHKTLFFRPPLKSANLLRKLLFMEAMGQLLWPYLGGVYLIVAKKRVHGVKPIRSKTLQKKKSVMPTTVPQPTSQVRPE